MENQDDYKYYYISAIQSLIGYEVVNIVKLPDLLTNDVYLGLLLQNGDDIRIVFPLEGEKGNGLGHFGITTVVR